MLRLIIICLVLILQIAQMIQKDKRIKKLNEILSGIKVIKMYAWEIPFGKLVGDIRLEKYLLYV